MNILKKNQKEFIPSIKTQKINQCTSRSYLSEEKAHDQFHSMMNNISCLYMDHLYPKNSNHLSNHIKEGHYQILYQKEKEEKINLYQQLQLIKKQANLLKEENSTLSFAYKAIRIQLDELKQNKCYKDIFDDEKQADQSNKSCTQYIKINQLMNLDEQKIIQKNQKQQEESPQKISIIRKPQDADHRLNDKLNHQNNKVLLINSQLQQQNQECRIKLIQMESQIEELNKQIKLRNIKILQITQKQLQQEQIIKDHQNLEIKFRKTEEELAMRKEKQIEAQQILSQFEEELQAKENKINAFIEQEISQSQKDECGLKNYQEKISHFLYLYRKKQNVYQCYITNCQHNLLEIQAKYSLLEHQCNQNRQKVDS